MITSAVDSGERLVVYLGLCDLLFAISHTLDHATMLATLAFPPTVACKIFAFCLNEFVLAQTLIVSFTAFNAFLMVVKGVKIRLGRKDWKLLLMAFGVPALFGIGADAGGLFGPYTAWQVIFVSGYLAVLGYCMKCQIIFCPVFFIV